MDELFFSLLGKAMFGIAFIVPLWYGATWFILQIPKLLTKWLFTIPKERRDAMKIQELRELLVYYRGSCNSTPGYSKLIREAFPGWNNV